MGDRESLDRARRRRVHARPHRARPPDARLRLLRRRAERPARGAPAGHGDLRGLADAALPHRPRDVRGPRHRGRPGGTRTAPTARCRGRSCCSRRSSSPTAASRSRSARRTSTGSSRRCSRRRRATGWRRATVSSGPSSPGRSSESPKDGAAAIYSGELAEELVRAVPAITAGRPRELPRDPAQAAARPLPRRGVRLEPAAVLGRRAGRVRAAAARGAGARRLARGGRAARRA